MTFFCCCVTGCEFILEFISFLFCCCVTGCVPQSHHFSGGCCHFAVPGTPQWVPQEEEKAPFWVSGGRQAVCDSIEETLHGYEPKEAIKS